jgi:hypothetical protein
LKTVPVARPSDEPLYDDFLQKLKQFSSGFSLFSEQAIVRRLPEKFSVEYTKEMEEFFHRMIVNKYQLVVAAEDPLQPSRNRESSSSVTTSSLLNNTISSGKATDRPTVTSINPSPNTVELKKWKEDVLKAFEVVSLFI